MAKIVCPLCRGELDRHAGSWRCAKNHSYDVAREGYVNLLPVQHKHSREPGDSEDMIRARREFLDRGHYQPLREAVVDLLKPLQLQGLLDLGCGEGWYTDAMRAAAAEVIGLDISKPAIRLAAKRYPGITWLVGSGASLPLGDGAVDIVCNIFTQVHAREMHRVLPAGGHVLLVSPAPLHLLALREALFDEVRAHEPEKFLAGFEGLFTVRSQHEVGFELALDQADLLRLLMMTPYAWKAKPDRRAALEQSMGIATRAAFSLQLLRKI